jgi:hypothetical protein
VLLDAAPARSQVSRTWVSGTGNDDAYCSRDKPCKTFAGAIAKTAVGGEINILDAGDFGGVTITKSISIIAVGATAGTIAQGINGIVIDAGPTGIVKLYGLDIHGSAIDQPPFSLGDKKSPADSPGFAFSPRPWFTSTDA